MIKLGITGGIGSGKTVVSNIFRVLDIPVFDADIEAKNLNNSSPVIREKLSRYFGEDLYVNDELNKKKFAELIFSNPENTQLANSIIHPELAKEYIKWNQKYIHLPFTVIDAALLFESGFQKFVDKVIVVHAPKNLRLERAAFRDKTTLKHIEARMSKQMPEEEKMRLADFVIYNDNKHSLLLQAAKILKKLSEK